MRPATTYGEYRYGFNGMEKDDEVKGSGNSYDFGARMYDSRLGRWLSIDAYSVNYPSQSPYVFVSNIPVSKVDIGGNWDIEVHVYNDRSQYGYGILLVKNNAGEVVARYKVTAVSWKAWNEKSNRTDSYGHTPLGEVCLAGWRSPGNHAEFGPNKKLEIVEPTSELRSGEESRSGSWLTDDRTNIQIHSKGEGKEARNTLKATNGCVRMRNFDILDLNKKTQALEAADPSEGPGTLNVVDDLNLFKYQGDYVFILKEEREQIDKAWNKVEFFQKLITYHNENGTATKENMKMLFSARDESMKRYDNVVEKIVLNAEGHDLKGQYDRKNE